MSRVPQTAVLLTVLCSAACNDRESPPTAPPEPTVSAAADISPDTRQLEGLVRRFALALRNPGFRAEVEARLDASPYPEGKIHLQRFLSEKSRAATKVVALENGESEQSTDSVARATRQLEVYLPVPDHRRRWNGDTHLLVATQARDGEIPVAFDLNGGRHFLDPGKPPTTPVLAVVPVETDFDHPPGPAGATCVPPTCGSGGGGGSILTPPGLYMTQAWIPGDFEGWLKGNPEYEVHVMGQLGTSDSLTDYQCAGEHAGDPYAYDQNGTVWNGNVLLFSQIQINSYKAAHPGAALRLVALEDDDTACQIKIDQGRWNTMIAGFTTTYQDFTGAIDSGTVIKKIKAAKSLYNLLAAIASWIKSSDDLVGNAIEDKVAMQTLSPYNWVLKDGSSTTGWLQLQMK
jgi:hypothetical protein